MTTDYDRLYAELYDDSVPNWPGEIDFYLALAHEARAQGAAVLDVACGTGRIALPLAQAGFNVTGVDLMPPMLDVARAKSTDLPHTQWIEGDMRTFDLGAQFGLAIMPGHVFQHMLTPADQVLCLENVRRHLLPGGTLVVHLDHQDMDWLGDINTTGAGDFKTGDVVTHPQTGVPYRTVYAWTYTRSTQTATLQKAFEQLDADGNVVQRVERTPVGLHCVFRFEMEHLLHRVGFEVEDVYGDFLHGPLQEDSSEMVWVAHKPQS